MIVENIGGAGGAVAVQKVLGAPADGHAQLLGTPMELVLAPMAMSAVKHTPEDLRLAGMVASIPLVMLVRKDIPATNMDEFIAWAKGRSVSYASTGPGSLFHVAGEKFAASTGLNLLHVPYKGGGQVFTDLVGGQIDIAFWTLAGPVIGLVKEGRVRALGIASPQAHALFPDVAPISRNKLLTDFNFDLWIGVQVPKGTPQATVEAINKAMTETMKQPSQQRGVMETGAQLVKPMNQAELDKFYASENERYRRLFKSIKLQPQ
ncbi:tripartite tricarboxylate transporter substrate binding protein [Polaromonas sp. P1(28)-13]|nr:tripartite tricarboxylate transporter substrate binding protein [Polaromonas sp. P1(28)-13]